MAENQTEGKEVLATDDEIATLLAKNAKLQEKESEGEGVKADYILLAKHGTKALVRSNKELYIEGLAIGDFFIQKDKINLGEELKVVPLAFITIYQEKDGTSKDVKFFGAWNKEQAVTFPLADGSYFNRQLPNGHILMPINWVMVEILGHPEIKNAVIAYKSTGSRIWKKWKEDAKSRSASSATLIYKIHEEQQKNDSFDWTDIGFEYEANLLETDKTEAVYCLKKSNAIRESYERNTLIGNHGVEAISALKATEQITDNSFVEDSFDDEDSGF